MGAFRNITGVSTDEKGRCYLGYKSKIQLGNRMNLRLGDKFNAYLGINYNYLRLENGDVNAFVSSTRLSYSFTPQVFLQSLIQYNNVTNITSINARFGWLKTANTGFCLSF